MNGKAGHSGVVGVLIFLGLAHLGCSSSSLVSSSPSNKRLSFAEFNLNAAARGDQTMKIVFQDNSTIVGQGIQANRDSVSWLNPTTGTRMSAETALIRKVVFRQSAPGEGAWIGALLGAGMGGAAAAIIVGSNSQREMIGIAWIVVPPIGLAGGTLLGLVVGAVKGHTDEYEFQNELVHR